MSWYGEVTMRTIGRGLLGVILLVAVPALPASGGICQFSPCVEEDEAPPTQAATSSSRPFGSGESVSGAGVSCQITPCPEAGEAPAIVEAKAAVTSDDGLSLSATAPNSCDEGCWSSGTYAYDGSGNITAIGGDEYHYDLVGRITRGTVVMPDGTTRTQSYAYDSFGNILDRTTDEFQVETSVDSTTNRPKSGLYGAYTWDAAGAMTFSGDNGESYEWDGVGMMTRRSGTRNLTFLYAADDERIAVFENDSSGNPVRATWTLRGLDHKVLRAWTSTGGAYATDDWQWKQDYVYRGGGRLLATVTPEGVRHFHLDHLGTPRVITDAQGVKLAEHTYFPFGVEATDERQNAELMKFTGHERDLDPHSIHDLDYMHARDSSPNLGRFLSVDPGRDWNARDPQTWNLYTYARNDPIGKIDPDGRAWGLVAKVVKVVVKGGGLAATVAGIVEDGKTIISDDASALARGGATVSLASEIFSPISLRDVKVAKHAVKKRGPKTSADAPHNAKISEVAAEVEDGTIIAGGRQVPERLISTPGGHKTGRRPDILVERPDGSTYGINVGRTDSKGLPVKRERLAIEDLEGAGVEMHYVPYDRGRKVPPQ